ncbi:MAG: hypothetical protein Q8R08_00580 [bacterium]|nr:hypothetical protein [bacterium]
MDNRLKEMMQELGKAINDALSESDRIAEAIHEMKKAGYDIFLVLEASIGFSKREEEPQAETSAQSPSGKLILNTGDSKFLRILKIEVPKDTA